LNWASLTSFPTAMHPARQTVQTLTGDLPTHRVIATRFAGNFEAEENGWWVVCIPKSLYSEEEINNHLQTIVARFQSQEWRSKP